MILGGDRRGRARIAIPGHQNIARALEGELKAMFDFTHLDPDAVAPKELEKDLEEIDKGTDDSSIASLMKE